MKTISQATMEVVLTHPHSGFTVNDIFKQVQEILPQPVKRDVINNYITYVWLKKKIINKTSRPGIYCLSYEGRPTLEKMLEKAAKKSWKAPPTGRPRRKSRETRPATTTGTNPTILTVPRTSPPETIDTVMIGEAIIAKINDYQRQIKKLQAGIVDASVVHKADVDAYKQIVKGKDSTIAELKRDIENLKRSASIKRRTMPLSEIAIFKRDKP